MNTQAGLNEFNIIGTLGRGAYGEVVLAKRKSDELEVAIKILDKKFLIKEKKQYQVLIEKEVLSRLNHPGIIKLISSFQSNDKIYFVVEFSSGGDFSNFIKLNQKLSYKATQFYVAEIVCQIEHMHLQGIAHRDVKPENILLTKDGHLKMIDFGTASFFDSSKLDYDTQKRINEAREQSRKDERQIQDEEAKVTDYQSKHKATFVGTAEYVSPELLEDEICGPEADLWALGCIVYKLFTGKTPFQDNNEYLIFQKVKDCQFNFPQDIPPDALDLIKQLLIRDPNKRLGAGNASSSFKQLKSHAFFKGIDFTKNLWNIKAPQDVTFMDVKKSQRDQDSDEDNYSPDGKISKKLSQQNTLNKPQIVMTGLIDKKVGFLIYKSRQLVLNDVDQPNLTYYDPQTNIQKGQIIFNDKVSIELDNKVFIVDVPGKKKYYFRQIEQPANEWVKTIKKLLDSKGIKIKITTS